MATTTTLNSLFSLLQKFGEDNKTVRTVLYGYDWVVDNKKVQQGIVMRYVGDNARLTGNQISYEFIVEFMDVVQPNDATVNNTNNNNEKDTNARDVMDDTLRAAIDLCNYLEQNGNEQTINGQEYDFEFDKDSVQILTINDSLESNYWGHQLRFSINFGFGYNYCEIPQ